MKVNKSWNGPITTSRPKKYRAVKNNIDENPVLVERRRKAEARKENAQIAKNHGLEGLDV